MRHGDSSHNHNDDEWRPSESWVSCAVVGLQQQLSVFFKLSTISKLSRTHIRQIPTCQPNGRTWQVTSAEKLFFPEEKMDIRPSPSPSSANLYNKQQTAIWNKKWPPTHRLPITSSGDHPERSLSFNWKCCRINALWIFMLMMTTTTRWWWWWEVADDADRIVMKVNRLRVVHFANANKWKVDGCRWIWRGLNDPDVGSEVELLIEGFAGTSQ